MRSHNSGLKYLFHVLYYDGTEFHQNIKDVSKKDPIRSAMYDVDIENVYRFWLTEYSRPLAGNEYLVDLADGHFEVNGVKFRMHEEWKIEPMMQALDRLGEVPTVQQGKLELVFMRRHKEHAQITYKVREDLSADVIAFEPTGHETVYRLGWKCTFNEKEVSRVMEID